MKRIKEIFLFNRNCPYFSENYVAEMGLEECKLYSTSNKTKHDVIHFETEKDYMKNVEEIGGYDPREWIFKFFYEKKELEYVISDSAYKLLGNCGYRVTLIKNLKKANYIVKEHSFYVDVNSDSTFSLLVDGEVYTNYIKGEEILNELYVVVGDFILNSLDVNL